jgi:lipopolysaccharide/colanic/teichoic acid biosynthesis glycosyltransferase
MFKFRSMRHAPAEADDRYAAMTRNDDDRVTKLGRSCASTGSTTAPGAERHPRRDEHGSGRDPEAVPHFALVRVGASLYRYRHIVRPGITGWAQSNRAMWPTSTKCFEALTTSIYIKISLLADC